ncbi:Glutathione hydrolase 1 proenzyme [Holothuria leucospilota]|uniref:Glutathione hydrolase 1 proenzyme n=1 Tax=Holothuria leucospilota TaxID=206669 RepID=A0A9Q1CGH6_HOLLE|nr:Glutathione hydrolase 1 proenzyme [Holothuria leucospilota]
MWELHKMYGKLPWQNSSEPSIRLAKKGFVITMALGEVIASEGENILNNPYLRKIFVKEDGSLHKAGDKMTRLKLADTLQKIAEGGKEAFYSGQLADDIILDIAEYDGIISKTDLETYNVDIAEAVHFMLDEWDVYAANVPAGGPILALILNILEGN